MRASDGSRAPHCPIAQCSSECTCTSDARVWTIIRTSCCSATRFSTMPCTPAAGPTSSHSSAGCFRTDGEPRCARWTELSTAGLRGQLELVPRDATHLVISIGGNDALQNSDLLTLPVTTSGQTLRAFAARVNGASSGTIGPRLRARSRSAGAPWCAPCTTERSRGRRMPLSPGSRWRCLTT